MQRPAVPWPRADTAVPAPWRPVAAAWRALIAPLQALADLRGQVFAFLPVCLAVGIGGYFALPAEPGAAQWGALAALGLPLAATSWRGPELARLPALALLLVVLGAGLAGLRAHLVAAPVLPHHFHGAIEGRIVAVDRSASDAVRLTLDRVVLEGIAPDAPPVRVRVALHGQQGFVVPEVGLPVILTGHLSPPPGPAEPGGFDFRRLAWFERLGAVGYTRSPVLSLGPAEVGSLRLAITRARLAISAGVQARMPPDTGAFAAAILTGDRAGIDQPTLEALRASNLAHLLAISGLHMGLLTGLVLGLLRLGIAAIPPLALRVDGRKLAAAGALVAATGYLALSGGSVATERAFIMVAVMLVAVLADRRAISLRSVALAATIILCLRPEALLHAGFQMSFAATVALVAVFGWLREAAPEEPRRRLSRAGRWAAGIATCSLVAGIATAPVSAAAFNRLAEYGLIANLLSVPLMGTVVMPAALVAAMLAPFGLAGVGLWVMDLGIRWILGVARWIAALEGAVVAVPQPAAWVLPAIALGGVWLLAWPGGRARLAGIVPVAVALAAWGLVPAAAPRPAVLIADTGTLTGVIGPEGRALSKATGERFVAESWLQADGDAADVATAHARPGLAGTSGTLRAAVAGVEVVHLTGRGAVERLDAVCRPGVLVVLGARAGAERARAASAAGCVLADRWVLDRTGSLALFPAPEGGLRLVTAAERAGARPWTAPARPRPAALPDRPLPGP